MKNRRTIYGFTLMEMLTAMAIIAIMIGLLIPAISAVQTTAANVKQKAQFNAIGIGLETFRTDAGDYPPSDYTDLSSPPVAPTSASSVGYCGAQKLAEALIGMDGFGFHPQSVFRSDGKANPAATSSLYITTTMKERKGPYLELEKANAVTISGIYPTTGPANISGQLNKNTYILCDMYNLVKNNATGKKNGLPVLYFRANTNNALLSPSTLGAFPWNTSADAVYNVNENFPFYANLPNGVSTPHPMFSDRTLFYKRIANPNFPGTATSPARPYRAQSFILLSAGADGLYGTTDDIYNIDENEK